MTTSARDQAIHDMAESVPVASKLGVFVCEHGTIHLILGDVDSNAFAALVLTQDQFSQVNSDIAKQLRELSVAGIPVIQTLTVN